MSKIKELEEAQQGYLAVRLAVEKTKPFKIERKISYETEDTTAFSGKRSVSVGSVSFDPKKCNLTITMAYNSGCDHEVIFRPIVIPLKPILIKALKEATE
jgi:hypothetical protein